MRLSISAISLGTGIITLPLLPEAGGGPTAIPIDRKSIVRRFNPTRNASSDTTPLQVGNGNFAFGADVTGLQTFKPFATMSSWGWHNFSLPEGESLEGYQGQSWLTQTSTGPRLVPYEMPDPDHPEMSQWMRENPHRINLGRLGLSFSEPNTAESDLLNRSQTLDMWTGRLSSSFICDGDPVEITTWAAADESTVQVHVKSPALAKGKMGMFLDFPYPGREKFEAPFVGLWNETEAGEQEASVVVSRAQPRAAVRRRMDETVYFVDVRSMKTLEWTEPQEGFRFGIMSGWKDAESGERDDEILATFKFTESDITCLSLECTAFRDISVPSEAAWEEYWTEGGFVDMTKAAEHDPRALELQRRVIQSQYLTRVNCASDFPPQESGLVNNGWYGKFHLEMYPLHTHHFLTSSRPHLLSPLKTYTHFLPSSLARAARQSYPGARWGKMLAPSGPPAAPGEINALLIWQQPHPFLFAELAYRSSSSSHPDPSTLPLLLQWEPILNATATFMAAYPWPDGGHLNLGPPLYDASENTSPNATMNPTFELAYWRFALGAALRARARLRRAGIRIGGPEEETWRRARARLAPLPVEKDDDGGGGDTYPIYQGIQGMWTDPSKARDHPAMLAAFGFLPADCCCCCSLTATSSPPDDEYDDDDEWTSNSSNPHRHNPGPCVDPATMRRTLARVLAQWDLSYSFGWDFALLAMTELRLGGVHVHDHDGADAAVNHLLHPSFRFDDAGYPDGGRRVPTPYFPGSSMLLSAVGMMAAGWSGADERPHWPEGWEVRSEGYVPAL